MSRLGWTVVLCVVGSAAASALVTTLIRPRCTPPDEPGVAASAPERPEAPTAPLLSSAAPPSAEVEARLQALEARLARLDGAGTAGTPATAADRARITQDVLTKLVAARGEQAVTITDSLQALVRLGDAAVPGTLELLRSGKDQSYGGGYSTSGGGFFKSYPRMRTVLLDTLRQIATPAARSALLDSVRASGSIEDLRDLFLMYGTTTDPEMTAAVSALVPDVLARMKEIGASREGSVLAPMVFRWIRTHRLAEAVAPLAALLESAAVLDGIERSAFATLVSLAPERAAAVAEGRMTSGQGASGAATLLGSVHEYGSDLRPVATFYELVFGRGSFEPAALRSLYTSMPDRLNTTIDDPEARLADARPLLAFMNARLAVETDEFARRMLTMRRDRLAAAIQGAETSPSR